MATCIHLSTFSSVNRLTQDDHAYENWLKSTLPNRQLHANVGFEQGTSFWGRTAGTLTFNANDWTTDRPDYRLLVESGSTRVGTSWTPVPTGWQNPERQDGYMYQVGVYGFAMAPDGSMGHVLLDNVRGEGT